MARRPVRVALTALFVGSPHVGHAQTLRDIAAWDALVVSPIGALPPRMHDELFVGTRTPAELSVRYGRWRYDEDDAIHNDIGLTVTHGFGATRTDIAVTVAYLSLSCGTCSTWLSGGVEVLRPVLRHVLAGQAERETTASLGVRASAGAARYLGDGYAAATSLALSTPVSIAFPFVWRSRVSVSAMPGIGVGRLASTDDDANGTLPMLGVSVAWALHSGVIMDLGIQRVFINGGPSQFGAGLSWAAQ